MLEYDWPQSPVHFTSVTALYRVQCGSLNHALARLKRWLGCGTHVVWSLTAPEHGTVCAIVIIMKAKIFNTTWISHFSINLISSTFRFIMGLVLILLMNKYCSLWVKLQIPPLSSAASVIICDICLLEKGQSRLGFSTRQLCLVLVWP